MDPASPLRLAARVESVTRTAKVIIVNLEAAKNAPENSKELCREMHAICDLLDFLNLALTKSENQDKHFTTPPSLKESISEFTSILDEMSIRVKRMGTFRLPWPFSKDENQRFLTKIELYKTSFTTELSVTAAYKS